MLYKSGVDKNETPEDEVVRWRFIDDQKKRTISHYTREKSF